METEDKIRYVFEKGAGYARTRDILNADESFYHLKKLEQAGVVEQVKRGLYRWNGMSLESNDLIVAARMIPNGVFCLLSAAEFHGLTTSQPWQHQMAIERSEKVRLSVDDKIKIFFWSAPLMNLGVMEADFGGGKIRVFDVHRTVCDLVKYRNKIGRDVMLEVIKAYVRRKDKDITQLLRYARVLRVENIIKPYLESVL